jgi:hypothetical protein
MSNSFREDWQVGTALLAALLALGMIGGGIVYLFTGATTAPQKDLQLTNVGDLCTDDLAIKQQVQGIILGALDTSLHNHVEHLFEVWMAGGEGGHTRAATGVRNGTRNYLHARAQIEHWEIPPCREQVK